MEIDEKQLSEMTRLPDLGGSPVRRAVLELNKELRKERCNGDLGMGMGYLALNIPEQDYRVLMVRFPDLQSCDAEIKHKAWQKFLRDPRSEPYKVRRNDGKRVRA
jgi:hypothetical protein